MQEDRMRTTTCCRKTASLTTEGNEAEVERDPVTVDTLGKGSFPAQRGLSRTR